VCVVCCMCDNDPRDEVGRLWIEEVVNERVAGWLASVRYRWLIEWSGSCTNWRDQSSSASTTSAARISWKASGKTACLSAELHWRLLYETESKTDWFRNVSSYFLLPGLDSAVCYVTSVRLCKYCVWRVRRIAIRDL